MLWAWPQFIEWLRTLTAEALAIEGGIVTGAALVGGLAATGLVSAWLLMLVTGSLTIATIGSVLTVAGGIAAALLFLVG